MCSWEPFLEDPNNLTSPLRRGALGPVRNRKTVEKIIQNRKTENKFDQNRKPHVKLSKPIHFHIPVIKTLIDPIQW